MIFHQTFLGKTPETFKAVNVDFAGSEGFAMVNLEMPVATECQRIIAVKFIGANNASAANLLDGHV